MSVLLLVTSFSFHTSEAGGLKIGMHNPYMEWLKSYHPDFLIDILPTSWDIQVQSFTVMSLIAPVMLKLEKSL